ncbi:hypothetical protein [Candidatus Scalindua japonica]|uniref:hypothetical protein n=1 Tax=Candidatus Scalindua japonica TaxID=1284222 RepID=UPI0013A57F39|nr:hypothetical protein [Candidatus Scalindua japonica]
MSKTNKYILSSSFVSIVISMCLLVNLFAPGFSTVIHNKSVALHPESHICKCNPEPHSISSCCCAIDINATEGKSLLKENYQGIFSTFIKSLGCAGFPDQLSSFSYNVTIPEDGITPPDLPMLHFIDKQQRVFPASIKISPPDKPPRHLA